MTLAGPEGFFSLLLDLHDVDGLQPFLPLGDLELDFVPFMKDLETVLFDGREMHEQVFAVLLGNKPKTLLLIEPFDFPSGHFFRLLLSFLWADPESPRKQKSRTSFKSYAAFYS